MTIQKIREDIKGLRGANVNIFGQQTTLKEEVEKGTVDILDVLDVLEHHEVDSMYIPIYDEHGDMIDEIDSDSVEEYLDYLFDIDSIEESESNNSYNWNANVSNHFDFRVYREINSGNVLVEFKVHRYGDVRANYTESALLEFMFIEDFYEALAEANYHVDLGNGLYANIDILQDGIEIYTEDGEYIETVCDMEEAEEFAEGYKK